MESQLPSHAVTDPKTKHQLQDQLDGIVARAMRRDPAQRYSSVADLSEDLEQYLSGGVPRSENFAAELPAAEAGPAQMSAQFSAPLSCRWSSRHNFRGCVAVTLPGGRLLEKHRIGNMPPTSPGTVTDAVRSIAVLPFEPLGQDTNDPLLGLGMAMQ
jgi:hypothetical protein